MEESSSNDSERMFETNLNFAFNLNKDIQHTLANSSVKTNTHSDDKQLPLSNIIICKPKNSIKMRYYKNNN